MTPPALAVESHAEAPPRPRVLDFAPIWPSHEPSALGESFRASFDSEDSRRILNVLIAVVGIILTAPIMLIVALLVKLTSAGPVFYMQTRVGIDRRTPGAPAGNHRREVDYGGRLFRIYKFRTMYTDDQRAQVWASPDDPRITPLGRVLRKYRLDELPQLLNVVLGDMNIVGPRPEQPDILIQLREKIDSYQVRQRVLPGITGWAQVNQQYDQNLDDVRRKVQLDLEYLQRCSPVEDVRIMARTIPVMLFRQGGW